MVGSLSGPVVGIRRLRGWRCLQSQAIRQFRSLRLSRTADGLHGLAERLHPFTARKVHRNPIQNGRCNEGNCSEMEGVSYLYQ